MSDPRQQICLTTADGRTLRWHKAGRVHDLPAELAQHWVAHFQPALFQVLPDGHIVPRGADPKAMDIIQVAIAPPSEPAAPTVHPSPG